MKRQKMNLAEFLDYFDFSYNKIQNDFEDPENDDEGEVYALIDNQHANLGGIENERFSNIPAIIDRLDIYYVDYIYRDLEEEFGLFGTAEELFEQLEKIGDERQEGHYSLLYYIVNPDELKENEAGI